MERRHSERISIHLNAHIFSNGKTYSGFIENVSEEGIEYLTTFLTQAPKNFTPNKIITLSFQIPSGETINLYCEVKWLLRTSPHEDSLTLGMKIIDPPQEYEEFLKSLVSEKVGENPG
jgi:hypothetical protein